MYIVIFRFFFRYSKDEYLKPGDSELHDFSYILTEPLSKYSGNAQLLQDTHEVVEFVDCFSSIGLQYQSWFPVKIKTKPCLGIMKRKRGILSSELREKLKQKIIENKNRGDIDITSSENIQSLEVPVDSHEYIDIEEITSNNEKEANDIVELIDQIHEKQFVATDNKPTEKLLELNPSAEAVHQSTKSKLKELIISHYRLKGSVIENEKEPNETGQDTVSKKSTKTSIKRIIKAEKIKELVDRISKLDLNLVCDLERMTTKNCLMKLIDDYDIEADG